MEIIKKYNEKNLNIEVEGRIDTITSNNLEESINEEMGKFDSLTLDFSKTEYISSAGLRVLISTHKKLNAENIPFVIKNVDDTIEEIFRMSGFDKILEIL